MTIDNRNHNAQSLIRRTIQIFCLVFSALIFSTDGYTEEFIIPTEKPDPSQLLQTNTAVQDTQREQPESVETKKQDSEKPALKIKELIKVVPVKKTDRFFQIEFEWTKRATPVVFARDHTLWVIFDRPSLVDHSQIIDDQNRWFSGFKNHKNANATVLSFNLEKDIEYSFAKKGNDWALTFGRRTQPSQDPLVESEVISTAPSILRFNVSHTSKVIQIQDPVYGDTLSVIPHFEKNNPNRRDFANFTILPSFIGFVVKHLDDQLEVSTEPEGFRISSHQNLAISSAGDRKIKRKVAIPESLFNFEGINISPKDLHTTENHIIQQYSQKTGIDLAKNREMLGKFYLATHRFQEAIGVFNLNLQDFHNDSKIDLLPSRTLKALGKALLSRNGSQEVIDTPSPLLSNYENGLLLAIENVKQDKYQEAMQFFTHHLRELQSLPLALRNAVSMLALEAASKLKLPGKIFANMIETNSLTPYERGLYDFYQAELYAHDDEVSKSWEYYKKAIASGFPKAVIESTLAMFPPKTQNIISERKTFESLRYTWRGDETELKLLKRISGIYRRNKQYEETLQLYEEMIENFSDQIDGDLLRRYGEKMFKLEFKKRQKQSPIRAIGFYNRYQFFAPRMPEKLTPVLLELVENYLKLDLLDQATEIIEKALNDKLIKKSNVAEMRLQLANLYYMDLEYGKAESTLRRLQQDDMLPPNINHEATLLMAQALHRQGKSDAALAILKTDATAKGLLQKAKIAWQTQKWPIAAQNFEKLINKFTKNNKPSSDLLLKLAVSHYNSDHDDSLKKLKKKYLEYMKDKAESNWFQVLTASEHEVSNRRKQLVAQLAAAKKFDKSAKQIIDTVDKFK